MRISTHRREHAGKAYVFGFIMILAYMVILMTLPPFYSSVFFEFGLIGGALLFYGLMNKRSAPTYSWGSDPKPLSKDATLEAKNIKELLSEANAFSKMGLRLDKKVKIEEVRKKKITRIDNLSPQKSDSVSLYKKRNLAFEHVLLRCELILGKDSTHQEAMELKGAALYQLGRYAEAVPFQLKALEQKESSYGLFEVATSHYYLKEYSEALRVLKKSLELDPSLTEGWILLYRIGMKKNDYRLALEALNEAIYLNPNENALKSRQSKLLYETLKESDLFSLVYPECWKCQSKDGFTFSGVVVRVVECPACGAQMRFSLDNIRKQLTLATYEFPEHDAIRLKLDELVFDEKDSSNSK